VCEEQALSRVAASFFLPAPLGCAAPAAVLLLFATAAPSVDGDVNPSPHMAGLASMTSLPNNRTN